MIENRPLLSTLRAEQKPAHFSEGNVLRLSFDVMSGLHSWRHDLANSFCFVGDSLGDSLADVFR